MKRFSSLLARLHLVLGLTLGSLVVVIGLSGTVLAFRGEIDRALNPALYLSEAPRRPPSLADVARTATQSGGRIATLQLPETAGGPYVALLEDGREVFVKASGHEVLGVRDGAQAPMAVVLRFHRTLLAGEWGHAVVGAAALGLLSLVVTGAVLWWPRSWRLAFRRLTVQARGPSARIGWDLHHAVGAYAAMTLAISSITGAVFAFKPYSQPVLAALTASPPLSLKGPEVTARPGHPGHPSLQGLRGLPTLTLDQAVAAGRRRFPDARVMAVHFPLEPTAAYRVDLKQAGEVHPKGRSLVWVDPHGDAAGEALQVIDPFTAPLGWRLYYLYNFPLHTGEIGSTPGRLLMALSGLTPAVLLVTGLLIRRMKRRKPAAGSAA